MGLPQTSSKGLDITWSNSEYEQQPCPINLFSFNLGFPHDGNLLDESIQSPAFGLSKPIHALSPPFVVGHCHNTAEREPYLISQSSD